MVSLLAGHAQHNFSWQWTAGPSHGHPVEVIYLDLCLIQFLTMITDKIEGIWHMWVSI